jgi:hypothetical protein
MIGSVSARRPASALGRSQDYASLGRTAAPYPIVPLIAKLR